MRFTSKTVARAAAFGVAAAAIAVPVAAATSANASSGVLTTPALSTNAPTPATSGVDKFATNNESVTVTGTGFTSLTPYTLEECSGAGSCDTTRTVTGTTGPTGGISTTFVLHTGTIGSHVCGTAAGAAKTALPSFTQCYVEATDAIDPATDAKVYFNPIVTLSSSTNLKNGQSITVSGGGFPAAAGLYVLECSAPALPDCDTAKLVTPFPDTDGNGNFSNVTFKIITGPLGSAPPCTSAKDCLIVAAASASDTAQRGGAPFSVAKFANKATKTAAKASSKKPKAGKKYTISGTVKSGSGVKGMTVTLMDRVGGKGKFKKHGTATTKAGGKFSFKEKGPKKSTQFEVVHAKQAAPGIFYGASTSKKFTVK